MSVTPAPPQSDRYPFRTFPSGWYAVAFSHELPARGVLARHYFGRELVVFRGESGRPAVLDAYCPHMGAHLGRGSRVEGEAVRCPFHGFRFDADGRCLSTPYPQNTPPRARAGAWPTLEANGCVLVYHHPAGREPEFEVPALTRPEWPPPRHRGFRVKGHPQETTENAVDLGHLAEVHGYRQIEVLRGVELDGPRFSVRYAMSRDSPLRGAAPIRAEFTIRGYGLGFSYVAVEVLGTGLRTHHFVFSTPIDGDRVDLRALMYLEPGLRPRQLHWALALLPPSLARALVARSVFEGFVHDFQQDFRIWESKRYVDPPALAPGDGPVGPYRQWARQFYPA